MDPLGARLAEQEARIAALERELIARARLAPPHAGRQVRLAKTAAEPGEDYPEGVPDRYWITFVDGNPPAYTERTDEPKETAWNLPNVSIPDGTTILVARHRNAGILSGQWYICTSPRADAIGLRRFELTSEFTSGFPRNASAKFLEAGEEIGSDQDIIKVDPVVTIADPLKLGLQRIVGDRGWATWMSDHGRWEVVCMQQRAIIVQFALTEDLDTTMGSAAAEVTDFFLGDFDMTDPEIVVFNLESDNLGTYVFSGEAGARGYASFRVAGGYGILQMQCPA